MERRGSENRLRGIRNAAGTAVLAMFLAACGSNNTETQKPTVLPPTEAPTPTMTVTPTETPMPTIAATPTPEATPTPTPEPTLKPIGALLDGKYEKVSASSVTTQIKTVFKNNPDVPDIFPNNPNVDTKSFINSSWKACQISNDTSTGNPLLTQQNECQAAIFGLDKTYEETGIEDFYLAADGVLGYAENTLPSPFKENLIASLK